jgi:transposase-like protein
LGIRSKKPVAGVQGARHCLLPGHLAGARPHLRDDTTYATALPSALACLQDDFEACITHLRFPLAHRQAIRTTNLLEQLFGEERRRTKVIPHAFGERALLKLMYAASDPSGRTLARLAHERIRAPTADRHS